MFLRLESKIFHKHTRKYFVVCRFATAELFFSISLKTLLVLVGWERVRTSIPLLANTLNEDSSSTGYGKLGHLVYIVFWRESSAVNTYLLSPCVGYFYNYI